MTPAQHTDADRAYILKAEMAALLHDIGKFTPDFVKKFLKGGGNHYRHCVDYMNVTAIPELSMVLSPDKGGNNLLGWFSPDSYLKGFGDLLRFHHTRTSDDEAAVRNYFGINANDPWPIELMLIMVADTLDSSSTKGIADIGGQQARLDEDQFAQSMLTCFLSSPLGEEEEKDIVDIVTKKTKDFQVELTQHLSTWSSWKTIDILVDQRASLLVLLEKYLRFSLGETRIPTNDVSLWQHSYATACIFKAMLARHIILGDRTAEEKGNLAHYKEKLAYLSIRWNEDDILLRALRPKDIMGRRLRLYQLAQALKSCVETEYCLGNEVYRDRDGICFLVPSPGEAGIEQTGIYNELTEKLSSLCNDDKYFPGDLSYKIVAKEIGIQVLGLKDVLFEQDTVPMELGPKKPRWITNWGPHTASASNSEHARIEICSCCGFRHVALKAVTVGSEGDDESKRCEFCNKLAAEAQEERFRKGHARMRKELLGVPEHSDTSTFRIEKLVPKESENSRLALVQGILDLRPFLSAQAFSLILARRPEDYSNPVGDQSLELKEWSILKDSIKQCLTNMDAEPNSRQATQCLQTFQQLFHDSRLGKKSDGRVSGKNGNRLAEFIEEFVYKAPFIATMTEPWQKIANYALRQHPAPSRLMRVWETTRRFCENACRICDGQFNYTPLSLDPSRFMILMPAENAWTFIKSCHENYIGMARRVRHILPLHMSVSIFYEKFPIYLGVDSMRRFASMALEKGEPETWTLLEKDGEASHFTRLAWRDQAGRVVEWEMPSITPDERKERFFSWFWIEDRDRPIALSELTPGMKAKIWPSTFDYEVLDASVRRFDIRRAATGEGQRTFRGRPHLFVGDDGPRPYPLEDIAVWGNSPAIKAVKEMEKHQVSKLASLLGDLHAAWKNERASKAEVFKVQAWDYIRECMEKRFDNLDNGERERLVNMAVDGSLFDVLEWKHLIGK